MELAHHLEKLIEVPNDGGLVVPFGSKVVHVNHHANQAILTSVECRVYVDPTVANFVLNVTEDRITAALLPAEASKGQEVRRRHPNGGGARKVMA
jgi:hypothetical protein